MDLNALNTGDAANRGAFLHLRHPKSDAPLLDEKSGEPVVIQLLGSDSAEYRKLERSQQTRRLERMARVGNQPLTSDEIEANALELLVGCTLGWKNIVLGEPVPFSPEAARRLYTNPGLRWLREQVDLFIGTRANFLGNS